MLRKPTAIHRVVVDQSGRGHVDNQPVPTGGPVLEAEGELEGELVGTYRRVQVVVPQEPDVYVSLTLPPTEAGPNRTEYKYALLPPGQAITFCLQPEQRIYMAAGQNGGYAVCTLIVEYCEPGD